MDFDRIESIVARNLEMSTEELRASFRPAALTDLEAVGELRDQLFVGGRPSNDREYLLWRYWFGRNRRFGGDYYVLEHRGRLIAGIGTEQVILANSQSQQIAWIAMDIVVVTDRRDAGLGAWMQIELLRKAEMLIVTGSNENSDGIVRRFFNLLDRRTYVLVLNSYGYFCRVLGSRKLALVASSATNLVLRCRTGAILLQNSHKVYVKQLSEFGDDTTRFHARLLSGLAVGITRTAENLNWRIFQNPRDCYQVFGAYMAGELRGYIALLSERGSSHNERKTIVDFAVDPEYFDLIAKALLRKAIKEAREERRHSLALDILDGAFEEALLRYGFISRKNEIRRFGFQVSDSKKCGEWLKREWRIYPIDGDVV